MARIRGLPKEKAGLIGRMAYFWTKKMLGQTPAPVGIAAHHSKLLGGIMVFETVLAKSHRVEDRLKALASIKTAALIGCPF